jgi:hypothetical protein
LLLSLIVTGVHAPSACALQPTKVSISVTPENIKCPPANNGARVTVTITGRITFGDQQAQQFTIRLVAEGVIFDDNLGESAIEADPNDPWSNSDPPRTFTVYFALRCNASCKIEGANQVFGVKNAGSDGNPAMLAIEVGNGRDKPGSDNFHNGFDSATGAKGTAVPVRCSATGETLPAITQWGILALGLLLAGSLAFMIRRRFSMRPARA